jgi:outer membrane lipoprotein SlyB
LTTLGGSLVGGLVGTGIERAAGDTTATEYIVRKANNDLVSVTQKDAVPLPIGSKVLVIAGSQARIVIDYTVPVDAPKAADAPKAGEVVKPEGPPVPVTSEPIPPPAAAPTTVPAGPVTPLIL